MLTTHVQIASLGEAGYRYSRDDWGFHNLSPKMRIDAESEERGLVEAFARGTEFPLVIMNHGPGELFVSVWCDEGNPFVTFNLRPGEVREYHPHTARDLLRMHLPWRVR